MKVVIFVLLYLFFAVECTAQERLNATLGLDFQALYYVGLRYQFSQSQIGVHYGFSPTNANLNTMMLSYHQHLFGSSKLSHRKPWFVRPAVVYRRQNQNFDQSVFRQIETVVCFGRDFNISKRFGSSLALGAGTRVYSKHDAPSRYVGDDDLMYNFLIGLDLNVYYRFANRKQ